MHGIIHVELKKYVETKHGSAAWTSILNDSGLSGKLYLPISSYPDEEIVALVNSAANLTRKPVESLLEDFGQFITPSLMDMYRSLIKPEWKTRELLLHTEETIHRVVRLRNPGAHPPQLRFETTGPNTLKFTYTSPRRMSSVAKGIIKGVANHYRETVTIQERNALDGTCEMRISIG
jgi:hypothetical protein